MIAFKATQRGVIAFRHHKDKRGRLTTDRRKAGVVLLDLANRHIEPDGVMVRWQCTYAVYATRNLRDCVWCWGSQAKWASELALIIQDAAKLGKIRPFRLKGLSGSWAAGVRMTAVSGILAPSIQDCVLFELGCTVKCTELQTCHSCVKRETRK